METQEMVEEQTLPDTLWELAKLALHDLKEVEKLSDKYEIEMGVWYSTNGKCKVCMAGAVAAQTCNLGHDSDYIMWDQYLNFREKFWAIDSLRMGDICEAHYELYGNYSNVVEDVDIIDYKENPELFKEQFQELIDYLKSENI